MVRPHAAGTMFTLQRFLELLQPEGFSLYALQPSTICPEDNLTGAIASRPGATLPMIRRQIEKMDHIVSVDTAAAFIWPGAMGHPSAHLLLPHRHADWRAGTAPRYRIRSSRPTGRTIRTPIGPRRFSRDPRGCSHDEVETVDVLDEGSLWFSAKVEADDIEHERQQMEARHRQQLAVHCIETVTHSGTRCTRVTWKCL